MAKIIKVGSQKITPNKIANPFKTTRTSTTNPFKYNNFEGNTLQFADVFEGVKPVQTNKLRMVASSVAGSMNKMKSSITEPIVKFVNKVRENIVAFNEIPAVKSFNEVMNRPIEINIKMPNIKNIAVESINNIKEGVSSKIDYLNRDVLEVGKDIKAQWEALIAKIPSRTRYTAETPVAELEEAFRAELALLGGV